MSEGIKDRPFKDGSAARQFNDLVRNAISKRNQREIDVIGVTDAEEQIVAQDILSDSRMQDLFERVQKGTHRSLGIVTEVEGLGEEKVVSYIDQFGLPMGFFYEPGAERFKDAPNGFKVGDLILNTMKNGLQTVSVKPVRFSPKTEKKVIRKFLQMLETRRRVK